MNYFSAILMLHSEPQKTYPNLAGQKAAYMAKQLKAYKAGTLKEPMMGATANEVATGRLGLTTVANPGG